MAKNNEVIEEILDNVDDHDKRLKVLENSISQILELLQKNQTMPPQVVQPVSAKVKVEYLDLKNAVYDGMASYFVANPQVAGGLDEQSIKKIAMICHQIYEEEFKKYFANHDEKVKKKEDELNAKFAILGIETIPQVATWASEYPPEVQRVMRYIGRRILDPDEPVETAHDILKVWGNLMMGIYKVPEVKPTIKAWLGYRWKLVKNYAHKKRWLSFFVIYILGFVSIAFLALYQEKVRKVDETNHVWYKTVIKTRKDMDMWFELDSILHKDNSFYNRLYK